jgi:hypothetical protein
MTIKRGLTQRNGAYTLPRPRAFFAPIKIYPTIQDGTLAGAGAADRFDIDASTSGVLVC